MGNRFSDLELRVMYAITSGLSLAFRDAAALIGELSDLRAEVKGLREWKAANLTRRDVERGEKRKR